MWRMSFVQSAQRHKQSTHSLQQRQVPFCLSYLGHEAMEVQMRKGQAADEMDPSNSQHHSCAASPKLVEAASQSGVCCITYLQCLATALAFSEATARLPRGPNSTPRATTDMLQQTAAYASTYAVQTKTKTSQTGSTGMSSAMRAAHWLFHQMIDS